MHDLATIIRMNNDEETAKKLLAKVRAGRSIAIWSGTGKEWDEFKLSEQEAAQHERPKEHPTGVIWPAGGDIWAYRHRMVAAVE